MTIARVHLVDPLVSRWYHCITRCVRCAKLLGEKTDRKEWIENRLNDVTSIPPLRSASHSVDPSPKRQRVHRTLEHGLCPGPKAVWVAMHSLALRAGIRSLDACDRLLV